MPSSEVDFQQQIHLVEAVRDELLQLGNELASMERDGASNAELVEKKSNLTELVDAFNKLNQQFLVKQSEFVQQKMALEDASSRIAEAIKHSEQLLHNPIATLEQLHQGIEEAEQVGQQIDQRLAQGELPPSAMPELGLAIKQLKLASDRLSREYAHSLETTNTVEETSALLENVQRARPEIERLLEEEGPGEHLIEAVKLLEVSLNCFESG